MKLIYISILLLSIQFTSTTSQVTISNSNNFPHKLQEPFIIQFHVFQNGTIPNIYVVLKDGVKIIEKVLIRLNEKRNQIKSSEYFEKVDVEKNQLLKLVFKRAAAFKIMEIFQIDISTDRRIFREFLDLTIEPQVEIKLTNYVINSQKDNFVTFQCFSYNGLPDSNLKWLVLNKENQVVERIPIEEEKWQNSTNGKEMPYNYIQITLSINANDTLKYFNCADGDKKMQMTIPYYKHPNDVKISQINSSTTLRSIENGGKLKCESLGGMNDRIDNISWIINDAPDKYGMYIRIDGYILTILNAPPWSLWNVSCVVTSFIYNDSKQLLKNVEFFVTPMKLKDDEMSLSQYSFNVHVMKKLKSLDNLRKEQRKNFVETIKYLHHSSYANTQFVTKTVCEMNRTEIEGVDDIGGCAKLVEDRDALGFTFSNLNCVLYYDLDVEVFSCGRKRRCWKLKIFIRRDKFEKIASNKCEDIPILKNVKSIKFFDSYGSIVLDESKSVQILWSFRNKVRIATSTQNGVRALAVAFDWELNKENEVFARNVKLWLTRNKCRQSFFSCRYVKRGMMNHWETVDKFVVISKSYPIDAGSKDQIISKVKKHDWGILFVGPCVDAVCKDMAKEFGFTLLPDISFGLRKIQFD